MRHLLLVLLAILLVMGCGPEGQKMGSSVMSVMDDTEPTEGTFEGIPRIPVSVAFMQDKITGPWLWMIAPTEPGKGGPDSIDIDSLAVASNGAVTEMAVATNGASEGDWIGEVPWTLGEIADIGGDNVNEVVNKFVLPLIGLGEMNLEDFSSYALISLVSDADRSDVPMRVGSDDAIKVWLNGEVVHNQAVIRGAYDFQDEFKVNLKIGDNLLLVKVSERSHAWSMFVGIGDEAVRAESEPIEAADAEEL
ncbi:hypothetical protein C6503_18105 [Candidatus Poribacteria bacterium]|nr:MAG: hypothetical protein C6503_18105 [Candidatus Poribacteria bacterium]